jgi:hypothetical protein
MATLKERRQTTVEQAWFHLASDILFLAIEDARQTGDPRKQENAKEWLLSPAAKLLLETLGIEIDIKQWVHTGCPVIKR